MPRYFFHRKDGFVDLDEEGTVLEDLRAARIQAVIFAGESLRDDPQQVWEGQDFRVEVSDESGFTLFTVVTLAIDVPGDQRKSKQRPPSS